VEGTAVKVSLVVVCHHSSGVLATCVDSFRREARASGVEAEVVVVEQSEDPGEERAAAAVAVDRLAVRPNRGYAAGLNAGVEEASGEIMLLANPDIHFLDGSLKPMLEALAAGHDVVGPQFTWDESGEVLFPPAEDPSPGAELRRTCRRRWQRPWRWGLGRWLERIWQVWSADRPVAVPGLRGPLLAASRDTVNTLGPMDEGYFLFYEETEWLWRARRRGARLAVVGHANVAHHWGHSTARRTDRDQLEAAARERYFERNYGPLWRRSLRWAAGREERAGVAGRSLEGPEEVPEVAADLWLVSTFSHLQPAVGAVTCSGLPERLVEVAAHGRWYALAAARDRGNWKTLGEWTWQRP
jgi:GT2 family glycosyltransferase